MAMCLYLALLMPGMANVRHCYISTASSWAVWCAPPIYRPKNVYFSSDLMGLDYVSLLVIKILVYLI